MARESFESHLERILAEDRMNRRRFVGRAGSSALAFSALGAFLAACGGAEGRERGRPHHRGQGRPPQDRS